jgi:hypothetical protein
MTASLAACVSWQMRLEEFRALGIEFVSLHEGMGTSTPNGRLVFGIFASIAEFEWELIRDQVRSGLALAGSCGRHLGRPRVVGEASKVAFLRARGHSVSAELDSARTPPNEPALACPKTSPEDCPEPLDPKAR